MSDSSNDEFETGDWVFYRDRLEWKDLQPIPQEEGPDPVVAIAYSDKFKDVYDYFRAVLKANELSERALNLTEDALYLNAANYTVWQYRRLILQHLKKDLKKELEFSRNMILAHQKNYQVWHHRMVIVQWMDEPGEELDFIADILKGDPKNYHAWQYRQWILSTFKCFQNELMYINELLEDDIRNNSAWNQRYFVINHLTDFEESEVRKELSYTMEAIKKATLNESAWNYLRGILIHLPKGLLEDEIEEFCDNLYISGSRSPHLLALFVDMYAEKIQSVKETEFRKKLFLAGTQLCKELSETEDPIRKNYWDYMVKKLEGLLIEATNK